MNLKSYETTAGRSVRLQLTNVPE